MISTIGIWSRDLINVFSGGVNSTFTTTETYADEIGRRNGFFSCGVTLFFWEINSALTMIDTYTDEIGTICGTDKPMQCPMTSVAVSVQYDRPYNTIINRQFLFSGSAIGFAGLKTDQDLVDHTQNSAKYGFTNAKINSLNSRDCTCCESSVH